MLKTILFIAPVGTDERQVEVTDIGPKTIAFINGSGYEVSKEYEFTEDGQIAIYV